MLEVMRRNARSFLIQILFAVIVIVFVFWGVNTGGQKAQPVARVNGETILDGTFLRAYQDRIRFHQAFNRTLTDEDTERIKNEVLDDLIIQELILQEAGAQDIMVSDHELACHIMDMSQFQDEEGRFDEDLYTREIDRYRQTRAKFEENQRESLTIQRLESLVRRAVQVSEAEVKDQYEKDNHKLDLEFVRVSTSLFRAEVDTGGDRVQGFLAEHLGECQAYYDDNFERLYSKPKRVKASQIMMTTGPDDSKQLADEVRSRMENVLAEINAGEIPFDELAKKYSEDASARFGGDLGFFDENRTGSPYGDEAFKVAAFAMEAGETSGLVETGEGLHVIRVEQVEDATIQEFDEVKIEIAERLLVDVEAPQMARQYAEELAVPFSQGNDPSELLGRRNLRVQETGLFSVGATSIPRIGNSPEILSAALEHEGIGKGPPTAFQVFDNWIVFRVTEEQEPDPAGFEAANDEVEQTLLRRKRYERLEAWRDSLKEDADIKIFDLAL